jgi:hypothetical protein
VQCRLVGLALRAQRGSLQLLSVLPPAGTNCRRSREGCPTKRAHSGPDEKLTFRNPTDDGLTAGESSNRTRFGRIGLEADRKLKIKRRPSDFALASTIGALDDRSPEHIGSRLCR